MGVAEYFKDHCEWFEDKAHQHWAFATKAEHKPKDWKMAQDILEHTNSIEASWKCEIQLTASPFEPAKSTEVSFILANATYKGLPMTMGLSYQPLRATPNRYTNLWPVYTRRAQEQSHWMN